MVPVPFKDMPKRITIFQGEFDGPITDEWMQHSLEGLDSDDVFHNSFLTGVIFACRAHTSCDLTGAAQELLKERGTAWVETCSDRADINAGLYVVCGEMLTPVSKLYDDTHGAFLHAIRPGGPHGKFLELKVAGSHCLRTLAVAVPSRAGPAPTPAFPLKGFRIAVKGIFEIENVRISVCNKAYYELYPPPKKTAACIQILIDAGATVVGTTKLASFAATEEPVECIDYDAPWNPRADGYQSPAGSSSGSGAAMAAYEWLDFTIGSDTSGSGRRPGHWNGCFAMRPTYGVLLSEGYVGSFKQFDTPTFYTRDLRKGKYFAESWYGKALSPPPRSGKPAIIYPTDYMSLISNKVQNDVIDAFVRDLESSLGVAHERISFNELWDSTTPEAANGMSLQEYMKDASRNSFFHDDYHSFDKFRKDYVQKFGKQPYLARQELSSKIAQEERNIAVDRLEVYRKWFTEHFLQVGKKDTLVLIPIEEISPRYRDEAPAYHFNPVGVPMLFVSPILGAPELTVPIGLSLYLSKVTGCEEKFPIAISILGSPGRDLELFDIASGCLKKCGRPDTVKPGKEMF
ncbi:amidase signature domain-containing protein [Diplogelasinospora grovesii]|uniref:Amidase signature domain-containing protein n=1 Tax=Diplogelasinospora grovesii TaxID=303347 RepID=A0AAN6NDU3_9PEZI|nr:amidase signature domain-containing protein [Diplogelasinospora grovesii]